MLEPSTSSSETLPRRRPEDANAAQLTAYLGPASASAPAPGNASSVGTAAAPADAAAHPLPPYADQDSSGIRRLVKRLKQFELTKAEVLMVLNLRPRDPVLLDLVVEECDGRLSAEDQDRVLQIIAEELGTDEAVER